MYIYYMNIFIYIYIYIYINRYKNIHIKNLHVINYCKSQPSYNLTEPRLLFYNIIYTNHEK